MMVFDVPDSFDEEPLDDDGDSVNFLG